LLKINTIFYSSQETGYNAGMKAIIVCMSGCNKKCWFCNTKQHIKINEYLVSKNLKTELLKYSPSTRVMFTGGEPLLQKDNILMFIRNYPEYTYYLETNGTIALTEEEFKLFTWVTVSPKDDEIPILLFKGFCHEIKIVWTGVEDLDLYENFTQVKYLCSCSELNNEMQTRREACNRHQAWRY